MKDLMEDRAPDWEAALVLALGEVDGDEGAIALRFAQRVRAIALDLPDEDNDDDDRSTLMKYLVDKSGKSL